MKQLRAALLVLMVLLAACAPGTDSSSSRIENFEPLFNLAINGKTVPFRDGSWVYQTPNFGLFTHFGSPTVFLGEVGGAQGIAIGLQNKTQNRLAIIWDDTSFIDSDGTSSRVFHTGVRYAAKDESQSPTVVAPNAIVNDEILPSDFTFYGDSAGWVTLPIIGRDLAADAGQRFRYYLTLERDGQPVNLDMVFTQKPPAQQ